MTPYLKPEIRVKAHKNHHFGYTYLFVKIRGKHETQMFQTAPVYSTSCNRTWLPAVIEDSPESVRRWEFSTEGVFPPEIFRWIVWFVKNPPVKQNVLKLKMEIWLFADCPFGKRGWLFWKVAWSQSKGTVHVWGVSRWKPDLTGQAGQKKSG